MPAFLIKKHQSTVCVLLRLMVHCIYQGVVSYYFGEAFGPEVQCSLTARPAYVDGLNHQLLRPQVL